MAAGIAHELKNPLAGIEVMAGLLRRQVPDSKDAQSLLADILSEAKLANAIVVEMLEFVRPVRLQVERTDLSDVLQQSVTMAESKATRGEVAVTTNVEPGLPMIEGDHHQLSQVFTNLVANAFEALDGKGHITISAMTTTIEADPAFAGVHPPTPAVLVEVADDGPGISAGADGSDLQPVFHDEGDGDRPRARHRPEDRRRPRRADRREQRGGDRDAVSRHPAGDERIGVVQVGQVGWLGSRVVRWVGAGSCL